MLYYMQLNSQLAPYIHIMIKITKDIVWFLGVLIILICMFANSFYLIGKNQSQFDKVRNDENRPIYDTIKGSL